MSFRANELGTYERELTLRQGLLAWYDVHARELPWRQKPGDGMPSHPYPVWVSETMLQQTRVAAVIGHYRKFLRRFPTVEKLAAARESSVLAAWSGLGYYRRARMLHAAAKVIARQMDGKFPSTAAGWSELPGIGRYTAAAVASISFDEPIAAVDGNVERVLRRISGKLLTGEGLWSAAERLLDRARPGDFNQAMMELGAMVCTPRAPACLTCPVLGLCATRGELTAPSRAPRQKKREIHFALARRDAEVLLVQRPFNAGLMPGMWELPEIARPKGRTRPAFTLRHSITVTDYKVKVWYYAPESENGGKWFTLETVSRIPLTGLAGKILRRARLPDNVGPSGAKAWRH